MKFYKFLVISLIGFIGNAQVVSIPDANFKAKLLEANEYNYIAMAFANNNDNVSVKIDINDDGEIQLSEALAIRRLEVSNSNITDLTGIEAFSNLISLNCFYNQVSSLNISGLTNLQYLYCNYNQLPSLDVSGLTSLQLLNCSNNLIPSLNLSGLTSLVNLDCSGNLIHSLNLSGLTSLEILDCAANQLPSLNVNGLTNLQSLDCSANQLPSLNLSGLTSLEILDCAANQLPSLNVSGLTNLQQLFCSGNQLPSLNVSGLINLQKLYCSNNQLPSIDVSGLSNLQTLYCENNQLPSLNLSGLTNLRDLYCRNNQLTNINYSGLTNLQFFYCSNNLLTSIDVSGLTNLKDLYCDNNQLTSLNVSGLSYLNQLQCSHNQLSTLTLVDLPFLVFLYCDHNQLVTLDVTLLPNLTLLRCEFNYLISLFVKNGRGCYPYYSGNNNLEYICADEILVPDIQSDLTQWGFINCHVNSYCSFTPGGTFYTIQGTNHYDSDSNGCNTSDILYPNLNFSITNGSVFGSIIANVNGNYSIPVQEGTHTITPLLENPTYFIISPTTATADFPLQASPLIQDFCITANGIHNDLEVFILPMINARPGYDATYNIIFKNKGTLSQSGVVNLSFDDSVLDYISSVPTVSSQAINSLSWSFSNLLPFETREINLTFNINSPMEIPAVNGGDVLNYNATIIGATDETPNDNSFTLNQTVVNSFDPNDKTCLEGTAITPSMVGQYVHYVIRFENTGTFAAQNVVIRDMIDTTKFDIATLVPQSSSHNFITRITNTNKVEFIFENINLPFDDANNDGYIAFKIKTKPTLVLGDTFSNSANIYFDFNFPIVTNNATTTIAILNNQDFEFNSMFSLSPVPTKDVLMITTKESVVMTSVSIYNTLGQLIQVNTNPNETIDVSDLQSGSYFIKIISDKGTASSKFIKE